MRRSTRCRRILSVVLVLALILGGTNIAAYADKESEDSVVLAEEATEAAEAETMDLQAEETEPVSSDAAEPEEEQAGQPEDLSDLSEEVAEADEQAEAEEAPADSAEDRLDSPKEQAEQSEDIESASSDAADAEKEQTAVPEDEEKAASVSGEYAAYRGAMQDIYDQILALKDAEGAAELWDSLMDIWDEIYSKQYNGLLVMSEAELDSLDALTEEILTYLQDDLGYDPYGTAEAAVRQAEQVYYIEVGDTVTITVNEKPAYNGYESSATLTETDNGDGTYTITITATADGAVGIKAGDSFYTVLIGDTVKVYVYVASAGFSEKMYDILGIGEDTLDDNNYFPAGEIILDDSFLSGKEASLSTYGTGLITSDADWTDLLQSLSEIDSSNLTGVFSANQGNKVGEYIDYAQKDVSYNAGSQHSALFRWNTEVWGHYGFEDMNPVFHLDLLFKTANITYVYGKNGIDSGVGRDGDVAVPEDTYIQGVTVSQTESEFGIPDGYIFDGYYKDADLTEPWSGTEVLDQDVTIYIKLVEPKSVDVGDGTDVKVGDTLQYTIKYYNDTGETTTVTITDTLDEGLDFVSANPSADYDKATRTVTWTISNVAADTLGEVTLVVKVNEDAAIKEAVDNTASVQMGNNPAVNTNTVTNPVPTKTVDVGNGTTVVEGDSLTYTIDYENGHDEAATVTITDVLDVGLDFVSATNGGTYDAATRTVTWTFTNVASGGKGSVSFTVTVNGTATDAVTNTASVKVGDDPAVSTNEVENPVLEPEDPTKSVDVGDGTEVTVGESLTYTIEYTNSLNTAATVTITDVLEEGLDFVSVEDGGTYDEASRTITWTIEGVEAHTVGSVSFTVVVNESAYQTDEVTNTASVQIGNNAAVDTNPVENPVYDPTDPGKSVNVGSGTEVQVGDELLYTITYENDHSTAAGVTITDPLDAGVDFVYASHDGVYDQNTHTVTWTLDNVAAHAAGSVTLIVKVNETALTTDEVSNTASVQVGNDSDVEYTNPVENPVEHPEDPTKEVSSDAGRVTDGTEVEIGDELTYTIEYKNGHSTAATVTITDVLDAGLDFVSATEGGTYDSDIRTITWVIAEVEAYTKGSVSFTATVNSDAVVKDAVENTASVQIGDDPAVETNPVENPIDDPEDPTKGVDVGNGTEVEVGDELVYAISYKNPHSVAATVTITDVLDEGLDFVSATPEATYNEADHTVTWTIRDVEAYGSGSVEVTVRVNEEAYEKDEVNNTASVRVGSDSAVDTNEVKNPVEEYFRLDEEIVTDENDRDAWVKSEAVNEYNAIEIEFSTYLPILAPEKLLEGEYTLTFHDVLESHLILDEADADFSVYIGGQKIDHEYYTITLASGANPLRLSLINLFRSSLAIQDDCSFHVDVDLTALYRDGVITEADLSGDTEIMIFFYADLEGTGLNGSYTSTVWYEVYNGDDLHYTSNVEVVEVYTYEIDLLKYDATVLEGDDYDSAALEGATLALYTDPACTEPVRRNGEPYTVTSDEEGRAVFYGLAEGTYYVKETVAPTGYVLSDEVLTVVLDESLIDSGHTYSAVYANMPEDKDPENPTKAVDVGETAIVQVGDELTYTITYYNHTMSEAEVTITDVLDAGLDFVKASDGGNYTRQDRTVTWTLTVPADTAGSVTVTATVNEIAAAEQKVENTAAVRIGDEDAVFTNTVENEVSEQVSEANPGGGDETGPTEQPPAGSDEGSSTTRGGGVKTGDLGGAELYWLIVLMAFMSLGVGALVTRRKRSRARE